MQVHGNKILSLAHKEITTIYTRDGRWRFDRVTRHVLDVLARRRAIFVEVKASTFEVQYAQLTVDARTARRYLKNISSETISSLSISKPKTSRGAKEWPARHDRAKSGRALRITQVATGQQSKSEYDARQQFAARIREELGPLRSKRAIDTP